MASKFYLLLLFILSLSLVSAQKKFEPTEADIFLGNKLSDLYPDDDIVILEQTEVIDFDYDKKNDKVIVINDFKQKLINLKSRTQIPLLIGYDNQSKISNVQVVHRNGQSASVRFNDDYYNQEDLFHSDARIKWTSLNFPLLGYQYTFMYKKQYKDIKYFVNTYLDSYYPVLKKTVKINLPNWLDMDIKEINLDNQLVKSNKSLYKDITQYTYSIENTAALPKEENSLGPTHYRPHLLYLAKAHTKTGKNEILMSTTKDLYNWYRSLVLQLNNTEQEVLEEKTISIIENLTKDEDKIKAIYYWVQDNIRYIAFEDGIAGFKPEEAIEVYRKKYGDCKGMANLTKQMMLIAGFDARLSWIGTKRIAYDYSLPTIAVDNHMICTVLTNEKKYFLDATEKFNPLGNYAERIQSKQVLIENKENFILDTIPSNTSAANLELSMSALKIENEKLIGKVNKKFKGESKASFLYNINSLKKDKKSEILEYYIGGNDKNLVVNNISVSDLNNREGLLELSYDLEQNNAISTFEEDIYIDIDYYKTYQSLDFKNRKTAFVFPHKIMEKSFTTIEIPPGYRVKELPKNLSINSIDFDIAFNYTSTKNTITYEKNINFKSALIKTSQLDIWKEFHAKMKEQYQQQIVLTKK